MQETSVEEMAKRSLCAREEAVFRSRARRGPEAKPALPTKELAKKNLRCQDKFAEKTAKRRLCAREEAVFHEPHSAAWRAEVQQQGAQTSSSSRASRGPAAVATKVQLLR